jgi:predicted DNA-binding ribbon-helix-helix protein
MIHGMRGTDMETTVIKKRSICVAGHKTSISLEDDFWQSLRQIAEEREKTVAQLIAAIDDNREFANLSSAIRLFILRYYRDQLDQEDRTVTSVAPPNGSHSIEIG